MSKHYISNKELHIELVISKAQGKLTKRAKDMLYLLATRIHRKFHYFNEDDRNDCFQEGLLRLYQKWDFYDPDRYDNPFAVLTEIYKRAAAAGFNKIYERNKEGWKPSKVSYYYNDDAGNERARI